MEEAAAFVQAEIGSDAWAARKAGFEGPGELTLFSTFRFSS